MGSLLIVLAIALAELWMIAVTVDRPAPDQYAFRGFEIVLGLAYGSVGALIASRRPESRIGWLLLAIGLLWGVFGLLNQYPVLSVASVSALPLADVARWVSAWIWVPLAMLLGSILMLIFPTGRLLSRRWGIAVVLALVATVTLVGSLILQIEPLGPLRAGPNALFSADMTPLLAIGLLLYLSSVASGVAALLLRYRAAATDTRQQIKWIAYAGLLAVPGAVAGLSPLPFGQVMIVVVSLLLAAAIAIAVLRYRLYEIDLIINRTLVYGALSAILAGVYTASITLSQRVFMAVTGERSDAAIVLTTLIVAATFTPLKGRLQATVDRRITVSVPGGTGPATLMAGTTAGAEALAMLGQLGQLHEAGVLTAGEFKAKKAELLTRV